jgi:hypothetical protein
MQACDFFSPADSRNPPPPIPRSLRGRIALIFYGEGYRNMSSTFYSVTLPGHLRRRLDALSVVLGGSRTGVVVRAIDALEQALLPEQRQRLETAFRLIDGR